MEKVYELKVRKTMLQKKGNEVIEALSKGSKIATKVFLDNDKMTNRITVYLGGIDKENAIGMVEAIEGEGGETFPQEQLRPALRTGYKAEIVALGSEPNTFMVKFTEIIPDVKRKKATADYDAEIKRVVEAGFVTEAEVRERIQVMTDLRIPKPVICDVLAKYRAYKKPVKRPSTIWVDAYPNQESVMLDAIINIMIGRAQIFEGPKSVGKNVAIETLAWLLNKPLYLITFNRYMCGDDIYGTKTTVPPEIAGYSSAELEEMSLCELKAATGMSMTEDEMKLAAKFKALSAKASSVCIRQEESQLIDALSDGGVLCFNEMNLAEANFFSSFTNQITDGTGFLFAPGHGRVDINPDFTLIGTQNAGYTGTCEQNEATMSRFGCIQFGFPGSIKSQLIAAVGKDTLGVQYFKQCDELYKTFLNSVKQGIIRDNALNIRGFVASLKAVANYPDYTKLAKQLDIQVVSTCPLDDRASLLAQVNNMISL